MMNISNFSKRHPVGFVIVLTVTWIGLFMVFMIASSFIFHKPYGDAFTVSIARLGVTACVLILTWRLRWLKGSGIGRVGTWQAWLLALGSLVYIACVSLYAFYGKVAFDFSNLLRVPDARQVILIHLLAALSEELLFRALVLYALIRVWGHSRRGITGSVLLASGLFALVHFTQVFTYGTSIPSALILVLQTFVISVWWGALVLLGGSIWPVVLLHFVGNAIVAVQGLTTPIIEPGILAFSRLLWFSLPFGVIAAIILAKARLHALVSQAPSPLNEIPKEVKP